MSHIEDRWKNPDLVNTGLRWRVRYRDTANRARSRSFRVRVDAERFRSRVDVELSSGTWVDPRRGKETVSSFSQRWLAGRWDLAPATVTLYRNLLDNHVLPHVGEVSLGGVDIDTGRDFLTRLQANGVGQNTVRKAGTLLRQIHQASVEEGLIAVNRLGGLRLPPEPREEMRFLSTAEVDRLFAQAPPRVLPIVVLGALGGLRIGEILGLTVADVDLVAGRVHVRRQLQELRGEVTYRPPKTLSGVRAVGIPAELGGLLRPLCEQRGPDEPLFVTAGGHVIRTSNFRNRMWKPLTESAGLEGLRFHDLRHTSVAIAIGHGAHPKVIQARLGHSKIKTTLDDYGHLFDHLDGELGQHMADGLRIPAASWPRPERCNRHQSLVSSPERWLSTFKGFGVVGDTGIEPVTSCVSCKRANQLRQSP